MLATKLQMSTMGVLRSAPVGAVARAAARTAARNKALLSVGSTSSTAAPSVGVFGVPGLHTPSDWRVLTDRAVVQCEKLRHELRSATTTSSTLAPRQLQALDGISNAVCSVIDVAELCRHVHAEPAWRVAAEESFEQLAGYIGQLNADVGVYECVRRITEDPAVFAGLGEEDSRFAVALRAEYERDGIQLSDAARQELQALHAQATALETNIGHAITRASQSVALTLPRASLSPLHPSMWQQQADQSTAPPGHAALPAHPHVLNAVVRHCPSPEAREAAYRAMHAKPGLENLEALAALAVLRHHTSVKMGFESFAHRVCHGHMCNDPGEVVATLRQLAKGLLPAAEAEVAALQALKFRAEGPPAPASGDTAAIAAPAPVAAGGEEAVQLEQWDLPHYMGLARSAALGDGNADSASTQFLPLEKCVQGLATLCRHLLGVEVEVGPAPTAESWADSNGDESGSGSSWGGLLGRTIGSSSNGSGNSPGLGSSVLKMTLTHPIHGSLGDIYLDLEPRPDKYGHSAHFTVRCGCLNEANEFQKPVVALVMNFSSTNSYDGVARLTHGELETLLHEFGHALHSLLSRTRYQHLSGTRAAADFVETPSQLMEHFAWSSAYLEAAGTPLPSGLLASLARGQKKHAALDGLQQVLLSLLDQTMYSAEGAKAIEKGGADAIVAMAQQLHREVMPACMPPPSATSAQDGYWPARFGHLTTYGATYYGYLFNKAYAAQLWQHQFAADPLHPKGGDCLWALLRPGGAADPKKLLADALGGQAPDLNPYFQEMSTK